MADKRRLFFFRAFTCAVVILQCAVAFLYADRMTYALEGLKHATAVYEGESFALIAPVMSIMGIICRMIHLHPLVFSHTVMILMIPLSYLSYGFLLKKIFDDNKNEIYISLLIIELINIYGFWSDKLSKASLLTGYYTGYAILLHIVMPIVAGLLISKPIRIKRICESETTDTVDDDYLEEWDMKKHPIINARNLAIALAVLAIVLLASVFVLNSKINTLYDATVNLQNQLNEYVDEGGK